MKQNSVYKSGVKLSSKTIAQWMIDNNVEVADVVDAVIEHNGIIGVGIIQLGNDLAAYCKTYSTKPHEGITYILREIK